MEETEQSSGVAHLAIAWVLLVPLFYFACGGGVWFLDSAGKSGAQATSGADIAKVLLVFGIVGLLILQRMPQVLAGLRDNAVFVAIAALALLSCVWSQFPTRTIENSIFLALNTLFAVYLYRRLSPERLASMLAMLGWICLILSFILISFYPTIGRDYALKASWRGIYHQKNLCGPMTIYLMSGVLFISPTSFLAQARRILFICLSIFLVVMTQSRGAWILLAFLLIYYLAIKFAHSFRRKDGSIVLFLEVLVAMTVLAVGISYWKEILLLLGKDATLSGRTTIWQAVKVSLLKRPLLGYGYMAFWNGMQGESANVASAKGEIVTGAHNGFLNVWLTLGAVGMVLTVYAVARSIKHGVACLRVERSSHLNWYVCVVLLTIVHSMDETQTLAPNDLTWIMFMVACIGLAEGAKRIRKGPESNPELGPENGQPQMS